MFCKNCGQEIKDDDVFCLNCGQPVQAKQAVNNSDKTIENKENVHKSKKKKSKKILLIIGIILGAIVFILFATNSQAKETLKKLQKYTEVSKVKDGYEFASDNSWTLCYTKDNETARIEDSNIKETLELILGVKDLGRGGDVYYNLDSEEIHINCETPFGDKKLTAVAYDTKDDEFRLMLDLEWYKPKKELWDLFEEYKLGKIFQSKIKKMTDDLKKMDLTKDDVALLSYKDIKSNIDVKKLKTVKKDKKTEVAKQEETVPKEQSASDEEFIGVNGTYNYMDSDGNVVSFMEISRDGQFCDVSLRNTELNYDIAGGKGRVMDNKTIHIPATGYTIICTWLDSEHVKVTREGDPYGMDAGLIMEFTDGIVYKYINPEDNTLVKDAYKFLVGNRFHLIDNQPIIYFVSENQICFSAGGEQTDKYYSYKISVKIENYHNKQVWREYITIGEEEYRLQYFSDGTFSLEGNGIFSGKYERI